MLLAASNMPEVLLKGLIGILVFLIGITVFSYLNIVSVRVAEEKGEKLYTGRSKCPHCGHLYKFSESIPVFSWLINRGKCPYCFEKISGRAPLTECFGGILALVIVAYYGISLPALTMFLTGSILTVITLVDIDTQIIPPAFNLLLAAIGLLSMITMPGPSFPERVIGVFCISIPMILIVLLVPGGFGGGDIKMMAASGLLLGWKGNTAAFLIGLILGGGYGIYVLATGKKGRKEHFAFGPCLSIGVFISAYAGIGSYLVTQYLLLLHIPSAG